MNRKIISLLFGAALLGAVQSCDSSNNSDDNSDSPSSSSAQSVGSSSSEGSDNASSSSSAPVVIKYVTDTAVVDYKGLNQVVYYDFSTGKKTALAHDTWHIAFDSDLSIVANGGNYGFGVSACSTGIVDFGTNFSGWKDSTSRYTRTDTNANVLGNTYSNKGQMTNQVYLIKTEDGGFYKFQVTGTLDDKGGLKLKIGSLDATTAETMDFKVAKGYNYTFVDVANKKTVTVEPLSKEWDIRFGRTEFLMGKSTSGRSSIGINFKGGVSVATITSKSDIDLSSVASIPAAAEFSATPLAIGSSWVSYSSETKVFTMQPVVYVVKTAESNYAKMRIVTFMGPNNEYYYSLFKYLYQADGASSFAK